MLASAGVSEHPELELEDAAMARVVEELTRLYLEDVDDPLTRRALEAGIGRPAGHRPAARGDARASPTAPMALRRLLELPFVDGGRDGLIVHEAVRDAVAGFLRATEPARYRSYRRAAWRELRAEIREAGPAELWRYTADMLYLIDNPVGTRGVLPHRHAAARGRARARRDDAPAISGDRPSPRGAGGRRAARALVDEAPETFSVVRERDGGVAGFFALVEGRMLRPSLVAGDPVLEAWARDLHDHPLPKGQLALGLRRWLDAERGERPCASQAACWLDAKRTYMALRPALRRMYVVVRDVPTYWPVVERLGFRPFADSVATLDGVDYSSVVLDFGPGSVDGWLAELVADELGVGDEPSSTRTARELTVQGARVVAHPARVRAVPPPARPRGPERQPRRAAPRGLGTRTSRAAATSSTPSCARCGSKLGTTPRWSRRCAAAATACAPTGARTSTRSSHRTLIERPRRGRSVAA